MKPEILYATTNPGKLGEVKKYLGSEITVVSPRERGLDIEVDETADTLEENALLKARAFHQASPSDLVMGDDTGLEIDALGGEPGVHVRRWKDGQTRLSDEEIIEYCLERLKGVPPGQRGAQFRTVIALVTPEGEEHTFDGILRGEMVTEPLDLRIEGFPFRGLFYVTEANCYLGELEDKPDTNVLTHRQRAVRNTVDWLKE